MMDCHTRMAHCGTWTVHCRSRTPQAHTVLSAFLAALGSALSPLKSLVCRDPREGRQSRVVLDAGTGRLAPGRMCLLLGPPGAGKTTLLQVLAGQALPPGTDGGGERETAGLRVRGRLQYNGLTPGSDFAVERAASTISQHDLHIGEMTVEEALMFAAECLGPGLNKGTREDTVFRDNDIV